MTHFHRTKLCCQSHSLERATVNTSVPLAQQELFIPLLSLSIPLSGSLHLSLSLHCTEHSPVLHFLAVDAHGALVALGNAHLVAAALHFLTGVLGGVQTYASKDTRNKDLSITMSVAEGYLWGCCLFHSVSLPSKHCLVNTSYIDCICMTVKTCNQEESFELLHSVLRCTPIPYRGLWQKKKYIYFSPVLKNNNENITEQSKTLGSLEAAE